MTTSGVNDPLVGTKIGPCRIEMRLAAGGMGVVYRAHHEPTNQAVAVKILAPSLAQDQEYVTRFFREAGAAGQIDHPNVIRVIDVGKHEEKYYIVMEFVAGETLDRIIERDRRLPLDRATRIVREIASGLAAAHRAGIIHRDVKPGNIIVSRDGRPHLTDFGLARSVGTTKKGLTIEGTFLGTPEYSSPEQVEGRKLDHRTDLYSLGVTYFQILSGMLPFVGESPMEIAIKRTREEARPLSNAYPGVDPRADALVSRLLKQDAGQRYQNMTEVIRELDAILTGEEAPATPSPTQAGERRSSLHTRLPQTASPGRGRGGLWLYWGLTPVAIALAFLSGALAARGGSWLQPDKDLVLRLVLVGGAAVAGAAAIFFARGRTASIGRTALAAIFSLVMLGAAVAAGAWLDRDSGAVMMETIGNSLAALGAYVTEPVNVLALALLALFVGTVICFEHPPGGLRAWSARILVLGSLFLAYVFGNGDRSLGAPFGAFLRQAELSVPLITATGLAGGFGVILLTSYETGTRSRTVGLLLTLGTVLGLFSFAVLVGQPDVKDGWMKLLSAPFADLGRAFPRSGTPLAVVVAAAAVQKALISGPFRRPSPFGRKR